MLGSLVPLNLKQWVEDNRERLKPPVCNQILHENEQFFVMAVGGPNQRNDFHVNPGEEIFFQVEGDITLTIIEAQQKKVIPIKEGEIFILPANIPHLPKRPENTAGLVIEKVRLAAEKDGFQWYCEHCTHMLYEEKLHIGDIVEQLPQVFQRFHQHPASLHCPNCGKNNRPIHPE